MRQKRAVEIWVGLFVGLGVAALFAAAFYVGNLSSYSSDTGYLLEARFDEIGGLKVRAPVTISGVQVGRVTAIHLDSQEYRAVVRMEIDPHKLPLQRVNEQGERQLGEQYVGLEPGGGAFTFLYPGDEVRMTQSSIALEQVIGQFLFNQVDENAQ
jgi:phospholipid/cholesterol/gamma-HCH transport system substrate-binding protein